jgi:DNA-binding MarR family transcriptional regulator
MYKLDESLGFIVRKAQTALHNRLFENFKKDGIDVSPEQWGIMVRLMANESISQSDIALKSSRNHSSITRIIDTMSQKNLVVRVDHPTDRRTNLITLSSNGKKLLEKLMKSAENTLAESKENISETDMQTCKDVLMRVIKNLTV